MPVTSFFFFKRNDAGHNLEAIVSVVADSLLSLDAGLDPVFLPKSNFASASALAAAVAVTTAHLADGNNPHNVTKAQVGLGNVTNVAQLAASEKGASNGVATLNSSGQLTAAQIPASLLGAMTYVSAWNANTNSPAIPAAAAGNKGWFYIVSVAGSAAIDGINEWKIKDWIVSNGSAWEKIDNTDQVVSVAGKQGIVALDTSDIGGLVSVLDSLTAAAGNIDTKEPLLGNPGVDNSTLFSTAAGARSWKAPAAALTALGAVAISQLGANSGVATLDSVGKLSAAQIPSSVLGGLNYQGTWNASTNAPAIPGAAAGNKGWYYVVATAGATSISGITDWQIGDWIVSNGAAWDKIDNTDRVASVAGRTGAVTLATADIAGIAAAAASFLAAADVPAQRAALVLGGARSLAAVTAVADHVLALPGGSPQAGDQMKTYITASGADRNLKLNGGILIPSASTFDNATGMTLSSGKLYVVQIEYDGAAWMLTTIVGGY